MLPKLPTLLSLTLVLLTVADLAKGQQWTANHAFAAGETAVYPQGSFVTNFAGVTLLYTAGASLTLQTSTTVLFQSQTTIYGSSGPETYNAATPTQFPLGKVMVVPPGTQMQHTTSPTVIRYSHIFGNDYAIVTYVNAATVFFNTPMQPAVYPAGTNSINYFNPGGSTSFFGPSPPIVNTVRQYTQTVEIVVTGYTVEGWPIRTYRNIGSGEVYTITQSSQNVARVVRTTPSANPINFLP